MARHIHYMIQSYATWNREGDGAMSDVASVEVIVFPDEDKPASLSGRVRSARRPGESRSDTEQFALERAEVLTERKSSRVNSQTVRGGYRVYQVIEHDDRLGNCQGMKLSQ